ncbi:MAG: protein adenylyltransferase SelO [Pseudobdellovibrionaceae bacterium]
MAGNKWGAIQVTPVPVASPRIVSFNEDLCSSLGLDLSVIKDPQVLSGNRLPPEWQPWALAYAGQQFGHFNILGEGRAHLIHEHTDSQGKLWDFQLKGSGQTPFSRRGDGRSALAPMLREYLISEAMFALGVPTTRSLSVVSTGEAVYRETAQPGGILFRVASSHLRVGTFQYVAHKFGNEAVKDLVAYAIKRHYPELDPSDALGFFKAVMGRQAKLIAQWMNLGFIHGVMNTDNMAISGETIDYGPCAFMDAYDPDTVFSSIDTKGRYRYGAQPSIAQWNLARLAECLLPLFHENSDQAVTSAQEELSHFSELFSAAYLQGLGQKLGLKQSQKQDPELFQKLFENMFRLKLDFTWTFRELSLDTFEKEPQFLEPGFQELLAAWKARLAAEGSDPHLARDLMLSSNPAIIPRNYWVEEALEKAVQGDLTVMNEFLRALKSPFEETQANFKFRQLKPDFSKSYVTFCGT